MIANLQPSPLLKLQFFFASTEKFGLDILPCSQVASSARGARFFYWRGFNIWKISLARMERAYACYWKWKYVVLGGGSDPTIFHLPRSKRLLPPPSPTWLPMMLFFSPLSQQANTQITNRWRRVKAILNKQQKKDLCFWGHGEKKCYKSQSVKWKRSFLIFWVVLCLLCYHILLVGLAYSDQF